MKEQTWKRVRADTPLGVVLWTLYSGGIFFGAFAGLSLAIPPHDLPHSLALQLPLFVTVTVVLRIVRIRQGPDPARDARWNRYAKALLLVGMSTLVLALLVWAVTR